MRSKKAIKNIISSLLQQIITIICGLILPRTIIGTYGSNVNGLVSSITQFLAYITLLEAGIGPVVKSVLYKPIANKDNEQVEKILKAAQKFFNVIAYIFIVYLLILCFVYPMLVNTEFGIGYTVSLILIISISTFAEYFLGMVYKLYLQANQKTYITANIQSITTILNTILCVVLIKLGASIQIVKLVSSFVFVLRPLIQNIYVKNKYDINLKDVKKKFDLKQKWDGLAQHIAAVIHDNTDITLLTIFTDTAEVSVYSVYMFVIKGIRNLIQAFVSGIDSAFGDMYVNNEQENLNKSFKVYELFYYTIITIIFSCVLGLILPFVQVYTKGVTDVNYCRPIFAYLIIIAEYIWAIRLPYNSIILAIGHFKETQKGAWIETITNIIISLILVSKLGMTGVAIGTLVAMTIRTVEFLHHSAKYILKRKEIYAYKHVLILIIETVIVLNIINFITRDIIFFNYIILIKYSIISLLISSTLTILFNGIVYMSETKEIINRIIEKRKNKESM